MTKYKINPEEWRKMSDHEKICEIISAFILENQEKIDDGTVESSEIIRESERIREMLRRQKKEREEEGK